VSAYRERLQPVPVARRGDRVRESILRNYPYVLAGSACVGLAAANGVRGHGLATVVLALGAAAACACADEPIARVGLLSVALLLGGWWWGSARLDALDSSVLVPRVGEAAAAVALVTGPARGGEFDLRVPARLTRFGGLALDEPVLLDLPVSTEPAHELPRLGAVLLAQLGHKGLTADVRARESQARGHWCRRELAFSPPLGTYLEYWPLRDGPNPRTEVDVLLATHGWWPWLLTLFILVLIVCGVIAYFVKRRRAAA
jgi:hypothetical protein